MILVLHYFYWCEQSFDAGSPLANLHFFTHWFWSGVDLFFVLSGFLIGGIIIDNRKAPNFVRVFYLRRALRILPAYSLLLIAYFVLRSVLDPVRYVSLFKEMHPNYTDFSFLTFTQNIMSSVAWTIHRRNIVDSFFMGPTWSLSVEEQFYLVVPFLLTLTPRKFWTFLSIVLAGLALLLRLYFPGLPAYVLTPFRMDSLFLGVLAALMIRNVPLKDFLQERKWVLRSVFIVLLALVGWFVVKAKTDFEPWHSTFLGCLFTSFLLLSVIESGSPYLAILRFPPLRFLGLISYGLYLFNQPVLWLAHATFVGGSPPSLKDGFTCLITLGALIVTMVVASLSYFCFERYFLSFGHSISYEKEVKSSAEGIEPYRPSRITSIGTSKVGSEPISEFPCRPDFKDSSDLETEA